MPTDPRRRPASGRGRRGAPAFLVLLAVPLLAPGGVRAETSPYSIGVSIGVSHDSNVFRTAGDVVGDTTRSVGLVAGFDQPIGRQRVYANASLSVDRHVRLARLDNTAYAINGGIDWSTFQHVSGTLRYAASRSLADYGATANVRTDEKNLQSASQLSGSASYAINSRLSVQATAEHRSLGYSAEAYKPLEYRQDVGGLNVRFGTTPLSFAVGVRETRGTSPNYLVGPGTFEDNDLRRRDLDLSATWRGAFTGVTARLSSSRESHSQSTSPAFSGLTGGLDVDHAVTSKVRVSAGFSRDTGSATTFYNFVPTASQIRIDTSQLSTVARLSANYAVTSKVVASLQARYSRGVVSSSLASTADSVSSYDLAVEWRPFDWLRATCSADRELRRSQTEGLGSRSTVFGCALTGRVV